MPNDGFFHRYPFTSLQELNADWLIQQVTDFENELSQMDTRVTLLETDVDGLKTRMTTAEGNISNLQGRMTTAEDDIDSLEDRAGALEDADIMGAEMLEGVNRVTQGASYVDIEYSKAEYSGGDRSASSEYARIPAANAAGAGVMLPAEKEKLSAFIVDGNGNATFSGTVAADSPTAAGELATKSYVDSLAISGSAAVTYDASPLTTEWHENGVTESNLGTFRAYSYGKVIQFYGLLAKTLVSSYVAGTSMFSAKIKTGYGFAGAIPVYLKDGSGNMIPARLQCDAQDNLSILPEVAVAAGTTLSCRIHITFLTVE